VCVWVPIYLEQNRDSWCEYVQVPIGCKQDSATGTIESSVNYINHKYSTNRNSLVVWNSECSFFLSCIINSRWPRCAWGKTIETRKFQTLSWLNWKGRNYLIYPRERKNWRIQAETPRHRSDAADSYQIIDAMEAHNREKPHEGTSTRRKRGGHRSITAAAHRNLRRPWQPEAALEPWRQVRVQKSIFSVAVRGKSLSPRAP
jgi:hypothetical protein